MRCTAGSTVYSVLYTLGGEQWGVQLGGSGGVEGEVWEYPGGWPGGTQAMVQRCFQVNCFQPIIFWVEGF